MMCQRRGGRCEAEVLILFSSKLFGDVIEPRKEGIDKIVEFCASGGQGKGTPMKELHVEVLFELEDLSTDSGLLDPIWHFPNGFGDPFEFGNVVKEFEMMNVHT